MIESKTREWPLVFFTVGLQLSAGISLVHAAGSLLFSVSRDSLRQIGLSVFPIFALAIAVSLVHVGRPHSSWRALRNVRESRLTKELISCGVFACFAMYECLECWWRGSCSSSLSIATAFAAVVAVLSSAKIYMIPAQPLWNSLSTSSSFVGSTIFFAGVVGNVVEKGAGRDAHVAVQVLTSAGAILFVLSTLVMIWRIGHLARSRNTMPEALPILRISHWFAVGGVIILVGCLPLIYTFWDSRSFSLMSASIVTVSATVGVSLGRMLMYSRGIALSRF